MKKLLLITSILFSLMFHIDVYSQEKLTYEDIKTGTFTYEGQEGNVEIIRTKREQIEIFNEGKSKITLKIEWVNDFTYILEVKELINAPGCLKRGDWIKASIGNRDKKGYDCSYTSSSCGSGSSRFIKLE